MRAKVTHKDFQRCTGEPRGRRLSTLANSCATDFETFGNEMQRLRELVADALVQVETLKIQHAGMLAQLDMRGADE
jgi:hypothetical protein